VASERSRVFAGSVGGEHRRPRFVLVFAGEHQQQTVTARAVPRRQWPATLRSATASTLCWLPKGRPALPSGRAAWRAQRPTPNG